MRLPTPFLCGALLCSLTAQARECPDAQPAALTLPALLARGVCLDPRLAQQGFELARTRGVVNEAAAARAWQVSLQAGPSASLQQGSGSATRSATGSANLVVTRLLSDGGLTKFRTAQREHEAVAAQADLDAARQDSLRELAGAWSDAREAQAVLMAARSSLDAARAIDEIARARFAAGSATRVDVLSAAASLAQAQREVVSSEVAWHRRQVVLAERLGWPADTPVVLRGDESAWLQNLAQQVGDAAPVLSSEQHPQLLAQAQRLQARRAALEVARAEEGATVSVSGGTGPNITRSNGGLAPGYETTHRWNSQVALTWSMPLSDGGARRSRVAQNQAQVDSALAHEQMLLRNLREAAWQQWTAWRGSAAEVSAAQAALDAAVAAESAQRGRYLAGAGTLADWIGAQSDLGARSRQAAAAEQARLRAAVGTMHALGRLALDIQP